MKQETMMPDYNNSILNMITSILNNYGAKNEHDSLPLLDKILEKKYKNIVLVLLDGMGTNVLNKASSDGLFVKNKIADITSVYPCTTTAALTTYYTGKAPIETGWIAWSQYFKEYGRTVDMLPYVDSYTKNALPTNKFNVYKEMEYVSIYEQIENSSPNVKTYEIKPSYCDIKGKRCIHINNIDELCNSIESLCKSSEKNYIFAYYDTPDTINHKFGWDSKETQDFILHAEEQFEKLKNNLQNTDTLILVCADHGHNNIKTTFDIMDLKDIQECLYIPPFLEPRCISFFVKPDKKDLFVSRFKDKFGEDYILYTKQEFLDSHLMGYGKQHKKIDDFIGDFIAISVSDIEISLGTYLLENKKIKQSDHCGLTRNEMEVPLIAFDLK